MDTNACDRLFYLYERGGSSYVLNGAFRHEFYDDGDLRFLCILTVPAQLQEVLYSLSSTLQPLTQYQVRH